MFGKSENFEKFYSFLCHHPFKLPNYVLPNENLNSIILHPQRALSLIVFFFFLLYFKFCYGTFYYVVLFSILSLSCSVLNSIYFYPFFTALLRGHRHPRKIFTNIFLFGQKKEFSQRWALLCILNAMPHLPHDTIHLWGAPFIFTSFTHVWVYIYSSMHWGEKPTTQGE